MTSGRREASGSCCTKGEYILNEPTLWSKEGIALFLFTYNGGYMVVVLIFYVHYNNPLQ